MKISDIGEFGLIERIRKMGAPQASRALIGIGDDAAAVLVSSGEALLTTTDLLLEGIHFDLRTTDLRSLGWKAAAVNLSDIAAMGGLPRFCLTALGIPSSMTVEEIGAFYEGLRACLERFDTTLIGGDTCRSGKGFCISVTLLGETVDGNAITRRGAAPGDLIFVTGPLGDSRAGLEILDGAKFGGKRTAAMKRLVERHVRPVPRIAEGLRFAQAGVASAMIDVSDGLSSDLGHICGESRVGAEVVAGKVPLSKELRTVVSRLGGTALDRALAGGEDYELLFTVPPERAGRLRSLRTGATEIGVITGRPGISLTDEQGRRQTLTASGYDHFRKKARRRTAP